MFYRQVIWNFAGKTSVWSWRNWTGRDCFGGCCHQTPHLCVAMETETGNDDRDQCFKGGGAKDLQEGQKEGSWKGKDEEGIQHLLRNQRLFVCVSLLVCLCHSLRFYSAGGNICALRNLFMHFFLSNL